MSSRTSTRPSSAGSSLTSNRVLRDPAWVAISLATWAATDAAAALRGDLGVLRRRRRGRGGRLRRDCGDGRLADVASARGWVCSASAALGAESGSRVSGSGWGAAPSFFASVGDFAASVSPVFAAPAVEPPFPDAAGGGGATGAASAGASTALLPMILVAPDSASADWAAAA